MKYYILRTEEVGASQSQLLFFEDDSALSALEHLLEYIKHLILLNEYTGTGPLVKSFWRWNEDDSLDELLVHRIAETWEMENLDWVFSIVIKESLKEITEFTVRIKGT